MKTVKRLYAQSFQHVDVGRWVVSPKSCSSFHTQMEAAALVSRKQDISLLFPEQTSSSKDKVGLLVALHVITMHVLYKLLITYVSLHQEIRSQFSHVRIIQGDGNCLYRSLFFALLESMIHNDEALEESVMANSAIPSS